MKRLMKYGIAGISTLLMSAAAIANSPPSADAGYLAYAIYNYTDKSAKLYLRTQGDSPEFDFYDIAAHVTPINADGTAPMPNPGYYNSWFHVINTGTDFPYSVFNSFCQAMVFFNPNSGNPNNYFMSYSISSLLLAAMGQTGFYADNEQIPGKQPNLPAPGDTNPADYANISMCYTHDNWLPTETNIAHDATTTTPGKDPNFPLYFPTQGQNTNVSQLQLWQPVEQSGGFSVKGWAYAYPSLSNQSAPNNPLPTDYLSVDIWFAQLLINPQSTVNSNLAVVHFLMCVNPDGIGPQLHTHTDAYNGQNGTTCPWINMPAWGSNQLKTPFSTAIPPAPSQG
ncbi:MAG: hypothetical protein EBX40_02925 [Gammaproteobacteria bacterium]|nr:hypothetical protein [Gammaproteobacteria bacterium]